VLSPWKHSGKVSWGQPLVQVEGTGLTGRWAAFGARGARRVALAVGDRGRRELVDEQDLERVAVTRGRGGGAPHAKRGPRGRPGELAAAGGGRIEVGAKRHGLRGPFGAVEHRHTGMLLHLDDECGAEHTALGVDLRRLLQGLEIGRRAVGLCARHAGKREGDQRHAEPLFDELGTFAEHAYLPLRTHFCTLSRYEDKHGSNSTQAPKVLN
jgi:hypothetical protein